MTSRFEFRLQLPLRLARVRRATLRRELAAAIRASIDADLRRAQAQRQLQAIGEERVQAVGRGITGADLQLAQTRHDAVARSLPTIDAELTRHRDEESRVRFELAKLSRELETLERLRREAYDAWRREHERLEQAAVDDAILVRRARARAFIPAGHEE